MRLAALLLLLAGSAQAQFVPGYLGDYRGLAAGSAPAALLPNTYGCFGDSIMAGACSGYSPCTRLATALPGASTSQWAVSGHTAQQIRDRYFANFLTACGGEECGTVVLEGGVNTLKQPEAVTGTAERAALALMLEVVDQALSRGRRVVWIGVLPYASCGPSTCPVLVDPGERARNYNTLLAAACAARAGPRLRCVLPYADFESTTTADYLRADYACADDGIHLQPAGAQALADLMLQALER